MPFASPRQRKFVMAQLSKAGFQNVHPKKITAEGRYYRARIEDPKKFQPMTFKTLDIGKPGGFKIIRAKPKGSDKYQNQAIILEK